MASGRRRVPSRLRLVYSQSMQNSVRERVEANAEQEPDDLVAEPPAYLTSQTARHIWRDILPKLRSYGLATELDEQVIALYCTSAADYRAECKMIKREGRILKTPIYDRQGRPTGNYRHEINPRVRLKQAAESIMIKCCHQLGLSPSSRAGLNIRPNAYTNAPSKTESGASVTDPAGILD